MAANGNGESRKRLEILEKAYLEDRERWRKGDERWRKSDERFAQIMARLEENDRKHDEFQQDFQDTMKQLVEHAREIRRLRETSDATLRILKRLLDK